MQKSLKSVDGGTFDQAKSIFDSIVARRKSRFLLNGELHGLLSFVSSRRYPNEFTEQLERQMRAELASTGHTSTFVYDKRLWDIKPNEFGAKRFAVFAGNLARPPCILGDAAKVDQFDEALVIYVPEEFRSDFVADLNQALRDIAGIANTISYPFITGRQYLHVLWSWSDS